MIESGLLEKIDFIKKFNKSMFSETYINISTDTRTIKKDDAFICLNGENFDAINFVKQALEKGAKAIIYNQNTKNEIVIKKYSEEYSEVLFLGVKDSLLFYQDLASAHIQRWKKNKPDRRVIGITGSNGKTTTKEMLLSILNEVRPGKIKCNEANCNNFIGVPKTLLEVSENHDYLIVEMGSNHFGEIKRLVEIAKPCCGIITNIGLAHIEFFINQEGVFKEKRALYDWIINNVQGEQRRFILNYDDKFLSTLEQKENVYFVSKNIGPHYKYKEMNGEIEINRNDKIFKLNTKNITGMHNITNLSTAFAMSLSLFPSEEKKCVRGANKFEPKDNRSVWIESNQRIIFLDAYNANPSSMKVALFGFFERCFRDKISLKDQIYILGDMNELGDDSDFHHQQIGNFLKENQVRNAVFIGEKNDQYLKGFDQKAILARDVKDFLKNNGRLLQKKDSYIFIKGSRSLQLESLIDIK